MTNINILCIMINKPSHIEEPSLIILIEINISLEIDFYYTILSLNLVIDL